MTAGRVERGLVIAFAFLCGVAVVWAYERPGREDVSLSAVVLRLAHDEGADFRVMRKGGAPFVIVGRNGILIGKEGKMLVVVGDTVREFNADEVASAADAVMQGEGK